MADQVLGTRPTGYLANAALRLAADAAEARLDWAKVLTSLRALSVLNPVAPEQVHLRIAQVARDLGDLPAAHSAFSKVYYEYPLTPEANAAAEALARLSRSTPPEKAALDLSRAHRFFGARRYADARKAYEPLRERAEGDERQLIELRLAECDVYLKRYPQAREALRAHVDRPGPLQSEAQYFYLTTIRELGREDEYLSLARTFVDTLSRSRPRRADAERARHVLHPEERGRPGRGSVHGAGAPVSARRRSRTAPTWKAGWWAYKNGQLRRDDSPVRVRGGGAAPRRLPAVVALLGGAVAAPRSAISTPRFAGYQQVIADYRNSYYGREAVRAIASLPAESVVRTSTRSAPSGRAAVRRRPPPRRTRPDRAETGRRRRRTRRSSARCSRPGSTTMRSASCGRCSASSGTSPLIDATIAYALNRQGELRPGDHGDAARVSAVHGAGRRAAAARRSCASSSRSTTGISSAATPPRASSIRILMAALIAQESTFEADIRSVANAWGLMQIIPATGRRYAQTLGIRPFRTGASDRARDERPHRHGLLRRSHRPVRRRRAGAGRLQRRRAARRRAGSPSGRASAATSSSTTFRSPRPRTTSSASSAPPRTTGSSTADG